MANELESFIEAMSTRRLLEQFADVRARHFPRTAITMNWELGDLDNDTLRPMVAMWLARFAESHQAAQDYQAVMFEQMYRLREQYGRSLAANHFMASIHDLPRVNAALTIAFHSLCRVLERAAASTRVQ